MNKQKNNSQKNTIIRSNSIELGNKSPLIIKNNEKINNITLPKSNDNKKKFENNKLIIPKEDKTKEEKRIIKKPQLKTPKSLDNIQKNKKNINEIRKSNSSKFTLIQREKSQKTIETKFDNHYFNNVRKNIENKINSKNDKVYVIQ